jgi:hypothetical protein
MPQPWKHPRTGVYYFRKVVPERLRPLVGKWEIKVSLGAKSLREAKLRYPDAAARATSFCSKQRAVPSSSRTSRCWPWPAKWYKRQLKAREDEPGDPAE